LIESNDIHDKTKTKILGKGTYGTCYCVSLDGVKFVVKEQELQDAIVEVKAHFDVWTKVGEQYLQYYTQPYMYMYTDSSGTNPYPFHYSYEPGATVAYSVQEYLPGFTSLNSYYKKLDESTLTRNEKSIAHQFIGKSIAEALGGIHSIEIVHCDLHDGNVMINPNTKEIKVIDFGLARDFSNFSKNMLRSYYGNALLVGSLKEGKKPKEKRQRQIFVDFVKRYPVAQKYEGLYGQVGVQKMRRLSQQVLDTSVVSRNRERLNRLNAHLKKVVRAARQHPI
jgi:serine/threonine protein kinase